MLVKEEYQRTYQMGLSGIESTKKLVDFGVPQLKEGAHDIDIDKLEMEKFIYMGRGLGGNVLSSFLYSGSMVEASSIKLETAPATLVGYLSVYTGDWNIFHNQNKYTFHSE